MRILQLWLTLPKKDRWTEPNHQIIPRDTALLRTEPGVSARLYSGISGDLRSRTRNHVPVTLVDFALAPGASIDQAVPGTFTGFFYVVEGEAKIGSTRTPLTVGQVGWLDHAPHDGSIRIANDANRPLRVLFYAGERQNIPIVWYGPFIGDSKDDIVQAFEG